VSQKIFLVGLPGAGKTTLGMALANHLEIQFIDLDLEIEKHTKQSTRSIFSEKGEAHFRQLEKKHLKEAIEELPAFVMATGGGTPCFFGNMEIMKNTGTTVFINTPIETIKRRLQQDTIRPLMQSNTLEELYSKRKDTYNQADSTVSTTKELIALFR